MFAHHDLVLFKVNLLGGKILIADPKDDSFIMSLGRFRRKVVEVDRAIAVTVYPQPTVAHRNLLRLRVEAILNQGRLSFEVNLSFGKGFFRLQEQGLAFLQLFPLNTFEVLKKY